ncbi:MAG: glycosyltransferase family 2 protein [Paludibacteraceae bacterium]|nr:glycosyltransferase family 2 protein [Paludibacteraceae bacterium]
MAHNDKTVHKGDIGRAAETRQRAEEPGLRTGECPLVSVVVPNYNHSAYLRERIETILNQTYPHIEIFLLDDASTDGSLGIMQEYAGDSRVRMVESNARNSGSAFRQWAKGIALAQGKYVWIAESDDSCDPHLAETLAGLLEQTGSVVAFCRSLRIDGAGRELAQSVSKSWRRDFRADGETFVRRCLTGYNHICNASGVMFRRDAAMRAGSDYTEYTASGDRLFWSELCLQGRVSYTAAALNRFRQHGDKVSDKAERSGLNICEDHRIYELLCERLQLSRRERLLACGYHYQAIHSGRLTEEARHEAESLWQQEAEYGRGAYLKYMLHRAAEKAGLMDYPWS